MEATIKHKTSGNLFEAVIYSSFVYLVEDMRKISREDFEAVQRIVKERKCPNKELIKNYPLSKKIYCGECGSLFKRRLKNEKSYWIKQFKSALVIG